MAKIETYSLAQSPISGSDKLIGTDSQDNNATKNFTINELITFIEDQNVYVPYSGAVSNINLNFKNISNAAVIVAQNLQANTLLYADAINVISRFAVGGNLGLSGQVLTSQGPSSAPIWKSPSIYKSYVATISQFGTSAPTVDYLIYNDLTNPVTFSYDGVGIYKVNCIDFGASKTVAFFQQGSGTGASTFQTPVATGYVNIIATNSSGAFANSLFNFSFIEIRVYP